MKRTYAKPIRYYRGKLVELCTSPDSNLGKAALEFGERITVYRVTQREDLGNPSFVRQLHDQVRSCP
eukprot:1695446-Karenia_brevis.AAC.1